MPTLQPMHRRLRDALGPEQRAASCRLHIFLKAGVSSLPPYGPCAGDYVTHWGQNSAPHHVDFMQSGVVCPFAAQHPATCRIWWVTTHQRLNHIDHGPDKPTARAY